MMKNQEKRILSIETSCDDTGVAVIERVNGRGKVLGSALSSQEEIHRKWGGVHPSEAKREHQSNFLPVLEKSLREAGILEKRESSIELPDDKEGVFSRDPLPFQEIKDFLSRFKVKDIDAIAVTVGPGLEPCLWKGINFARALSFFLKIPIIPVNHIKGHIFAFLLEKKEVTFPAVALVVSGGHTELLLLRSTEKIELLGKTRDDAAGECLDKTARILGLPYPGGPEIERAAKQAKTPPKISLPRPMLHSGDHDFSFSGLKTAVLYGFQEGDDVAAMAGEIQEAVTDVLVKKLEEAMERYGARTAILGGGVTANQRLREKAGSIKENIPEAEIILPSSTTDNAEMIGAAALMEKKRENYATIEAQPNLIAYEHGNT